MFKDRKNKIKLPMEDRVVDFVAAAFAIFLLVFSAYPIYYCFISSISDGEAALGRVLFFLPIQPTLENYKTVFKEPLLFDAMFMTVLRTVVGTITGTLFTAMIAYPLSKDDLKFRKFYTVLFIVTMYFSGGVIPQYLVYREYGITNTFGVYIFPGLMNVFNLMLCMNFFKEIPKDIIESARIDGVGEYKMLAKIILPLSTPIIATLALFIGVGHWNDWFMTAYFTTDKELQTLPTLLMRLVTSTDAQRKINEIAASNANIAGMAKSGVTSQSIRYATLLISIIPIMMVYPFIQKYFNKGIMLGAVKA